MEIHRVSEAQRCWGPLEPEAWLSHPHGARAGLATWGGVVGVSVLILVLPLEGLGTRGGVGVGCCENVLGFSGFFPWTPWRQHEGLGLVRGWQRASGSVKGRREKVVKMEGAMGGPEAHLVFLQGSARSQA